MSLKREPAVVVGFCGAVLTALADHVPYLSTGAAAAIIALITASVMAYTTRPVTPALFVGVLTAAVALVAEYGVVVSDDVVSKLTAVLLAGLALVGVRPQVTPVADPRPDDVT